MLTSEVITIGISDPVGFGLVVPTHQAMTLVEPEILERFSKKEFLTDDYCPASDPANGSERVDARTPAGRWAAALACRSGALPVSYTHLTLPTIYSV